MKIIKTIGGIIVWLIVASIAAIISSNILSWLSNAFKTDTTLGSIIFIIITMPVIFSISLWICMLIGYYFSTGKISSLVLLIVCGLMQVLTLLMNITSITTWVVTVATLIGFGFVYFGKGYGKD